jgi:hypothetical protein
MSAMPILAILFGVLLDFLGTVTWAFSQTKSITALIPAFFGTALLVCGVVAKLKPNLRKHLMHVAALVGLLGTAGGLGRGLPKAGALIQGTLEHPLAAASALGMGVLCLIFVVLCVKSFIDARRARRQGS